MDVIIENLKKYFEYKNIKPSRAEKMSSISNGTLSKAFNSGTSIKTSTLEAVLEVFDDINTSWLLGDGGEMIKSKNLTQKPEAIKRKVSMEDLSDQINFIQKQNDLILSKIERISRIEEMVQKFGILEEIKKELESTQKNAS